MRVSITSPVPVSEHGALLDAGRAQSLVGPVAEVMDAHAGVMDGVAQPTAIDRLKRLMPIVDNLGWVAIDGFYEESWLSELQDMIVAADDGNETKKQQMVRAINPLRVFFGALSKLHRNGPSEFSRCDISFVTRDGTMHDDKNGSHTFLSNPVLWGRSKKIGEYQFESKTGKLQRLTMRPNQLVILGGSALWVSAGTYSTVRHRAHHINPNARRARLMSFSESYN